MSFRGGRCLLRLPVLFINFKAYEESTGANAMRLASSASAAASETGKSIALVPQFTDMREIARKTRLPCFAQHVDPIVYGSHTGSVLPSSVKQAGAAGTVLGHAEKPLSQQALSKTVFFAKRTGLLVMACASAPKAVGEISRFNSKPDFVAIEPPELIGDPNTSVASADPGIITSSVREARGIPVIVGAGIKDTGDVEKSIELGAKGVFVSSAIKRARQKKKALLGLLKGFP